MHRNAVFFFLGSVILLGILGAYSFWELNRHEGLVKEYYRDGSLRSEVVFKNGLPNDTVRLYYKNGHLRRLAYFKDGKQQGQTLTKTEHSKPMNTIRIACSTVIANFTTRTANFSGKPISKTGLLSLELAKTIQNPIRTFYLCTFMAMLLNSAF